jgi:hypothetical protein
LLRIRIDSFVRKKRKVCLREAAPDRHVALKQAASTLPEITPESAHKTTRDNFQNIATDLDTRT